MGGCYRCGSWRHSTCGDVPRKKTTLEVLREDIKTARGTVSEGTVVKFHHGGLTYAAIFMGGKWYVTGNKLLGAAGARTHNQMMDVLAQATYVRLAADWTEV